MTKQQTADEVRNFIEYFSSSDDERATMLDSLNDYIEEVYQEPSEVMVFTSDVRKGQDIFWKRAIKDTSPTSEFIPAEELHIWVAKYKGYGWAVKVN
jgi:hypothetical protein